MAELNSFKALAQLLSPEGQLVSSTIRAGTTYAIRNKGYKAFLEQAGKDFVAKFKAKIDNGSSEWPALRPQTVTNRELYGYEPIQINYMQGLIRDNIDYNVEGFTVKVGVGGPEQHENPYDSNASISVSELVDIIEFGTNDHRIPKRPIFTGSDWPIIEAEVVSKFERNVIMSGSLRKVMNS